MKRFLTILMIVAILGGCFAAACAETDNPYADLEPEMCIRDRSRAYQHMPPAICALMRFSL